MESHSLTQKPLEKFPIMCLDCFHIYKIRLGDINKLRYLSSLGRLLPCPVKAMGVPASSAVSAYARNLLGCFTEESRHCALNEDKI